MRKPQTVPPPETARLRFREYTMDDLPLLLPVFADAETMEFLNGPHDEAQTRERLELLHTRLVAARRTHPDGANEGDFLQQWLATIEAAGVGLLENLLRVMQAHLTAIHNYRPARYDGSITLLAAEESAPGRQHSERQNGHAETQPPADYGWQRVSTLPVQVMQVPGDHLSMMALPHVRTLARGLQALLDRAARDDEALPAQMPQQAGKDEASF